MPRSEEVVRHLFSEGMCLLQKAEVFWLFCGCCAVLRGTILTLSRASSNAFHSSGSLPLSSTLQHRKHVLISLLEATSSFFSIDHLFASVIYNHLMYCVHTHCAFPGGNFMLHFDYGMILCCLFHC